MKQTRMSGQTSVMLTQAIVLFFASVVLVDSVWAADLGRVSAATMITNFAASIPNLMRLTTAVAYVLGMYFIVHGIALLKKYGDTRTQMSGESSLKGPLLFIAVGAALIYMPTSVQQSFATFWTNPSPYAYKSSSTGPFKEFINACFLVIQLIGTIYFIKGLVMLTNMSANSQQGGFSRALTHIIGGIFCIDLYDFLNMIFVTLGLGEM